MLWWNLAISARLMSDTRSRPQRRQDVEPQVATVLLRGALLDTHGYVLAVEALGQLADGDRLPPLLAHFRRVAATLHIGQRLDGTGTRLIHRQYTVRP
jgi:hypothetical protein